MYWQDGQWPIRSYLRDHSSQRPDLCLLLSFSLSLGPRVLSTTTWRESRKWGCYNSQCFEYYGPVEAEPFLQRQYSIRITFCYRMYCLSLYRSRCRLSSQLCQQFEQRHARKSRPLEGTTSVPPNVITVNPTRI